MYIFLIFVVIKHVKAKLSRVKESAKIQNDTKQSFSDQNSCHSITQIFALEIFETFCNLHYLLFVRRVPFRKVLYSLTYSQVSINRANSLNTYRMVLSELARLIET